MNIFKAWLEAKFIGSDRGAALVEYALLLALIAVVAMVAVMTFGGNLSTEFSSINSSIG